MFCSIAVTLNKLDRLDNSFFLNFVKCRGIHMQIMPELMGAVGSRMTRYAFDLKILF